MLDAGSNRLAVESASGTCDGVRRPDPPEERTELPIGLLRFGDSPRASGQDQKYAELLAESEAPLPPILVNRRSMQVVDGVHRVLAALLGGRETIDAVLVDVSREDAFLLAVESNTRHGLPLSQADRRAAAARLIASHPHLSDRAIARVSGLGAKSVAAVRRSAAAGPQLNARVGKDGRVRPLDRVAGRQRAAAVLARNPTASLREVARLAGISPATASDVRKRLLAGGNAGGNAGGGEGYRDNGGAGGTGHTGAAGCCPGGDGIPGEPSTAGVPSPVEPTPRPADSVPRARERSASLLEPLLHDPSVRGAETGRRLLRLLQFNVIGVHRWFELAEAVPPHCDTLVIALARQNADTWREFAQALDERMLPPPSPSSRKAETGQLLPDM